MRQVSFNLEDEDWTKLRKLSFSKEKTKTDLIKEGLKLVFEKYGVKEENEE